MSKVAFLHAAPEWTGTVRLSVVIARALAQRGHKVTLLLPANSAAEQGVQRLLTGGNPEAEKSADVDVIQFDPNGSWFGIGRRIRKLFRRWDLDAVVVHNEREHFIAAAACFFGRHGTVVRRVESGASVNMSGFARWPMRLARTHLLFSTQGDANAYANRSRKTQVSVAPVGIDVSAFPEPVAAEDGSEGGAGSLRYILCVRDPNSRGRAAMAIRTLARLAPRHEDLRLVVLGGGSDHEDLKMQAAALDILELVSFLGDRDENMSLMQNADLGWVVGEGDAGELGALELMASGVPLLAPAGSAGSRYIADGINGAILPDNDPAMTAAKVVTLLSSDEQRRAMGQAGRARAERDFPVDPMYEGFERAISGARRS